MKALTKRTRMRVAIALLASLASASSWAAADCSQTVGSVVTLTMPSNIFASRDAPIGAPLTGWIVSPLTTNWFNCTTSEGWGSGTGIRAYNSIAGQSVSMDGINYTVFKTGMNGIGMIIGSSQYRNGCGWNAYAAVSTEWRGSACNAQGDVTNGGEVRVMLVKTANIAAGIFPPTTFAIVGLFTNALNGPILQHPTLGFTFITSAANVYSQTCRTPDVSVFLESHKSAIFTGPGSSSQVVSFDISLNACPAGMAGIDYQLEAATPVLDLGNAVVSLDASSSAAGIGVQILEGNGNPAVLGSRRSFSGYNAGTGGNFKIPLRARYRQTGSTVTPGSANTAIRFTIYYL